MAFNVYEMLGTLDEAGGFTKASKFFVEIYPPRALAVSPTLFFLCESTNLPGITITSEDVKVFGYGINEKRANGVDFNGSNIPMSFFNDSNGKVLTFFHRWLQTIYNFNLNINPAGTSRGVPMNTLSYPQEYNGIVTISHFDESGEQIIQYTLNDAYPVAVGDIPVDWGLSDQLVRIPVTMAYSYWTAETLDPGVVDERSRANYYATQSVQTRTDFELKAVRELLFITSPSQTNRAVNQLSNLITFL